MKTRLVNLRTCTAEEKRKAVRIDRTTIFGNPFPIGPGCTRKESVAKYKVYFYDRIKNDPKFREAVENLRGEIIACWCAPLFCHGNIIVEYLERN